MEIDISNKVNQALKYGIVGIVFLAIIGSVGIWLWQRNHNYITIRNASVTGTMVNTNAKVPGEVIAFLVNEGDMVEVGQAIAKLKVKISPEQIQQLEQAVEGAKARYQDMLTKPAEQVITASAASGGNTEEAEAAVSRAAKNKERMDSLYAIGGISAVQHKQATAAYEAASDALNLARRASVSQPSVQTISQNGKDELLKIAALQVKQAEIALETNKKNMLATEILSPVDGIIHFTGVQIGDNVDAGQSIAMVGDGNNVWVEMTIDHKQSDRIKLGQFVEYAIADYPGKIFKGTVYEIVNQPLDDQEVNGIPVKVSLPAERDVVVKQGMNVTVKISI